MNRKRTQSGRSHERSSVGATLAGDPNWLGMLSLACIVALLVVATLRPADSVGVVRGDALCLLPLAVLAWMAQLLAPPRELDPRLPEEQGRGAGWRRVMNADSWFTGALVCLVVWIGLAGWQLAGTGNLRYGVNQWWWWVTVACGLWAPRGLVYWRGVAWKLLVAVAALAVGQSVYSWHQMLVSLPADRARFAADPEAVMQEAGTPAEVGSPIWDLFRARLEDAGPTGTFPLANSLAAYLLLGLVIVCGIGLTRLSRHRLGLAVALLVGGLAIAPILVWTESRGGYGATLAGLVVLVAGYWTQRRIAGTAEANPFPRKRFWGFVRWSSLIVMLLMSGAIFLIAMVPAVWTGLPRTLAFRGQYWRATMAMVADNPLFGAGPGNFKDRYLRFRLEEASESIMDPHNWLMETLAEGGVPALALLAVVLTTGIWLATRDGEETSAVQAGDSDSGLRPTLVLIAASVVAYFAVAVHWALRGELAFDPVILGGLGSAFWFAWVYFAGGWESPGGVAVRWVAMAAVFGLAIHLLVAGGWTVPGLIVPGMIAVAIATAGRPLREVPSVPGPSDRPTVRDRRIVGIKLAIGVCLLGGWWGTAWQPTRAADAAMQEAEQRYARGDLDGAYLAMQRAAEADRWAATPALRAAELANWRTMVRETPRTREDWLSAVEEAQRRAAGTPLVRRELARQRLIHFQRYGQTEDLTASLELLDTAIALSPTDVGQWAQRAVVLRALGEEDEAQAAWQRATDLAAAGGHAERSLDRVRVLVPQMVGEAVFRSGPQEAPADVVWRTAGDAGA